jgi:hypothetical protein
MKQAKRVLLRLPHHLHVAVRRRARRRLRSVNNELIVLLKMGLVSELSESAALAAADRQLRDRATGGEKTDGSG